MSGVSVHEYPMPSEAIATSIVLPTIGLCIIMVIGMLVGIQKCKQWELDKVVEMRRTRRVVQRITARLREKNFRTIQRARAMRKRKGQSVTETTLDAGSSEDNKSTAHSGVSGNSPPPSYEDALLDEYYREVLAVRPRRSSVATASTSTATTRRRRSSSMAQRRKLCREPAFMV